MATKKIEQAEAKEQNGTLETSEKIEQAEAKEQNGTLETSDLNDTVKINDPQQGIAKSSIPQEVVDNEKRMREMVEIKLFKDNFQHKDDLKVINPITGKLMIIKRGVKVEVPRCVAEIIKSSLNQDEEAAALMEELEGEALEAEKLS